ncbi:orotidine-5'-phosphate decarboxylase [Bdellovibrionota bacterium FG-2]
MPNQTTHHTDLIVALDFPRTEPAFQLVKELGDLPVIYKVGSELFLAGGPDLVRELVHQKKRIFLDLKFHDIPNTVARAIKQATLLRVEMLTVHLAGGSHMLKSVVNELAEIESIRTRILGVSVLTSFDDVRWAEVTKAISGHAVDVMDSVLGLVEHSVAWGVDGVVCSAIELKPIREQFPGLYTVVPGIRPQGFSAQDQARVITPNEAHLAGASAIVVGRPICESEDPRKVTELILRESGQSAYFNG